MKHLFFRVVLMLSLIFTISVISSVSSIFTSNIPLEAKASDITDDADTTKVKLNVSSKSLVKEDSYTLKVYRTTKNQKVVFKSSDSDIVTVKKGDNKDAEITGVKVGEATVTATVKEGFKTIAVLKCNITITPPAACITFTENDIILKVGDTVTLKKELKPATPYPTAEIPVYTVKNSKVVSLSLYKPGTITALAPGKTTICATVANGSYDTCTITVIEDDSSDNTQDTTPKEIASTK